MSLLLLVQVGNPIKLWRDETEPDQLCSSYLNLLAKFRRTNCYLSTTKPFEVQFGQPMLWFYETLMYIKLREFRAQLNLFGEVTNTSISEAFKCSRPQAFNLEDQVCSENQAWSIDVSAPVWECRRLLPHGWIHFAAFYDKNSFWIGPRDIWKHMNCFSMWTFQRLKWSIGGRSYRGRRREQLDTGQEL